MSEAVSTGAIGATPRHAGAASDMLGFTVEIHLELETSASAWDALERIAPASPYQTQAWARSWLLTRGSSIPVDPLIIVARDQRGQPLALLPFATWRRGPLRVAGFLGGRDSNCNLGLFRSVADWDRRSVLSLLRRAAARSGAGVDLVLLRNQPLTWEGEPNPLAWLPSQASPSFMHKVELVQSPDLLFRELLSKDTRKKLRRKAERLQELGPVLHQQARTEEQRQAFLDAFVRQRTARNQDIGLDSSDLVHLRRFFDHASRIGREPAVEIHALLSHDRVVATFIGSTHRSRFSGMSMSFDTDPALARCSPGELMVRALLADKCHAGVSVFDLGIGEARYKDTYCPTPEPLVDAVLPITPRGLMFAQAERFRLSAKRSIKQSSLTWSAVRGLRRALARVRRS